MSAPAAALIIAASEADAKLYYACRFLAPDPFVFLEDIHELPRIGRIDHQLRAGNVVTVEPGLYYAGRGAVRIEDMVVVEADGCRNLTCFHKMELLEL
jgi:hypothetical protein